MSLRRLTYLPFMWALCFAFIFCGVCVSASAQSDGAAEWGHTVPLPVKEAFDDADHNKLTAFFGGSVDLQLPNASGIFSRKQSEMILSKFLSLHPDLVFSVDHEEAAGELILSIGTLSSSDESFRVSMLLQPVANSQQIKQLRIENQK